MSQLNEVAILNADTNTNYYATGAMSAAAGFTFGPFPGVTIAYFSDATSIWGNTIAVGDPLDGADFMTPDWGSGKVYIYEKIGNNYILTQKIVPPTVTSIAGFGATLDLYCDILVVSEVSGQFVTGGTITDPTVYIYQRESGVWNLQSSISSTTVIDAGTSFGSHVAIWDNTIIVGQIGVVQDGGPAFPGKIFVFKADPTFNIAVLQEIITAPTASGDQLFPFSIAFQDNLLVASDIYYTTDVRSNAGVAFVYQRFNESTLFGPPVQTLSDENGLTNLLFGIDLDIHKNTIIVGELGVNTTDFPDNITSSMRRPGGAHVYDLNEGTWTLTQLLTANTLADNMAMLDFVQNGFGFSVAINDNVAYVSSPIVNGKTGETDYTGFVIRYTRNDDVYTINQKIDPSLVTGVPADPSDDNLYFGAYIDCYGTNKLVSAGHTFYSGFFVGAIVAEPNGTVYVYENNVSFIPPNMQNPDIVTMFTCGLGKCDMFLVNCDIDKYFTNIISFNRRACISTGELRALSCCLGAIILNNLRSVFTSLDCLPNDVIVFGTPDMNKEISATLKTAIENLKFKGTETIEIVIKVPVWTTMKTVVYYNFHFYFTDREPEEENEITSFVFVQSCTSGTGVFNFKTLPDDLGKP